ncbi:efflux RND transporter periplasmic adaptor subunit [Actinoplanes awajinensis]|uniref:Macrolide transporter n=1 Tax=Actinoplanes awajinensis subsp. mycoplanecinus TaxID=135947 RepID=A0A117MNN8_9ACTN|nr:efflux RND transporter periplasmic adaptor subunit [Actinoplanes awajinensis]KUL27370.1 macrolide transporter [Actinoplanes awajinensis subsp. mycoplanecinus]
MGVALAGRRRLIWFGVAVVVLALLAYGVIRALTADGAETTKAAETATVDKGAVTTEVATTGTLAPAQTRSLSFAVDGTVESVKVRAGTTVTAGEALATVNDDDAQDAVDAAQDALDSAEDTLADAKAASTTTSTSSSSCDVAAAYRLQTSASTTVSPSPSASATASPSPSATKTATAKPTATKTATAKPTATKTRGTTPGGGGTGGTCSSAGSGSSGGGQQGGQSSSGDAILSAQQRVNQAEVTLEEAEEALEGATITAPIAGRILSVSGKVGSQVSSGSTFVTLADVYDMQISAAFPEADADHLAVKQKAVITLADKPGEDFQATLVVVDPVGTSDGTLTTFGVVLSFVDAPEDLLVGQSAQVKVTTGSKTGVLRVPTTAVHDVSGTSGTVQKDGGATKVVIGLRGDQYTEIASGLTEGDVVSRSW